MTLRGWSRDWRASRSPPKRHRYITAGHERTSPAAARTPAPHLRLTEVVVRASMRRDGGGTKSTFVGFGQGSYSLRSGSEGSVFLKLTKQGLRYLENNRAVEAYAIARAKDGEGFSREVLLWRLKRKDELPRLDHAGRESGGNGQKTVRLPGNTRDFVGDPTASIWLNDWGIWLWQALRSVARHAEGSRIRIPSAAYHAIW